MAAAASALAGAGVGPARVEAELLLGYVLGVSRGALAVADPLTPEQQDRLAELVRRRTRHEPLQHLLGSAAFRYLDLAVGPGVFVPRPETELLAGWGVEQARRLVRPEGGSEPLVVDLCSGSGAIALSVAGEVPRARVVAVERAAPALDWLRRNAAERAGAGDRPIEVLAGDVADPELLAGYAGRVDVLLCNPPYVPDGTPVPPDVAGHDPADAVFGGPDGLAVIRLLLPQAARLLRPGGMLGIEHDDTHGTAVPELLRDDGRFVDVADHPDLVGRPRFATARRAGTQE
ncbi:peptide chain release factor N(5)-glutamine methyltransferase [Plantactinospora sp. WMMB782]|uniref:peptide chain release factor N(5)-glutamine methyltransferase n=1 Tax=Plantactinospora sp. WMMB782 TaxID=3404121 RepID=UPI003B92A5BD